MCFFSLLAFSPLSLCPFSGFLFCFLFRCFLFFASFSFFLLFFLDLSFICFVLSSFFGFSFLPSSPLPSFPSPSSSFSFPFWFLLLSPLTPLSRLLSRLSLPFLLLLPFRLFLLCPLTPFLSSSFVSVSFPLPSSSLHAGYSSFLSVLAASLVSSSSSSLSSWPMAFGLSQSAFWVLLLFSVFSRVGIFGHGVLIRSCVSFFSPHFSWAPSCAFASPSVFFSALPYLPYSVPLLSIVLLFVSFLSSLLLCLSLRLLLPRLRSPLLIPLSSAFLSSAPLVGEGGCLRRSGYVT